MNISELVKLSPAVDSYLCSPSICKHCTAVMLLSSNISSNNPFESALSFCLLDRAGHFEIPLRLMGHPVPAAQTGGGWAVSTAARRPFLPRDGRLHLPVVSLDDKCVHFPQHCALSSPCCKKGGKKVPLWPSRGQCLPCVNWKRWHKYSICGADVYVTWLFLDVLYYI